MPLNLVTHKANRNVVVFLLLDGGNFNDYVNGRAVLRDTFKVTVPLTTPQLDQHVEDVDPRPYTTPNPSYPTARWYPGWALLECDSFETPSEDLGPDDYSIDGATVYYQNEAGTFEKRPLAEVDIIRDGGDRPIQVRPKP